MAFVTVFCPLTTTGAGELVLQAAGERLVVLCKTKFVAVVGQERTTCLPANAILKSGDCARAG